MRTLFADAAYFVATLNPQDDLHDHAVSIGRTLDDCLLVTTEMVLTEVLNFFAERDAHCGSLPPIWSDSSSTIPTPESFRRLPLSSRTPWNFTAAGTIRSGVTPIAHLSA